MYHKGAWEAHLPTRLIVFDKSFTWFEETIYHHLLQILSFLELVLLIRPFVASAMFFSPIRVKTVFLSFNFTALFGIKGQLDRFHFFFSQTWQQRENIVTWSGGDKIACRNKDGM